MTVLVYPEKPIGGEFTAKVTVVDSIVDTVNGTIGIQLELANPDYLLPSGLGCEFKFMEKIKNELHE